MEIIRGSQKKGGLGLESPLSLLNGNLERTMSPAKRPAGGSDEGAQRRKSIRKQESPESPVRSLPEPPGYQAPALGLRHQVEHLPECTRARSPPRELERVNTAVDEQKGVMRGADWSISNQRKFHGSFLKNPRDWKKIQAAMGQEVSIKEIVGYYYDMYKQTNDYHRWKNSRQYRQYKELKLRTDLFNAIPDYHESHCYKCKTVIDEFDEDYQGVCCACCPHVIHTHFECAIRTIRADEDFVCSTCLSKYANDPYGLAAAKQMVDEKCRNISKLRDAKLDDWLNNRHNRPRHYLS